MDNEIVLVTVEHDNIDTYTHLAQAYEAEFSAMTEKMPNQDGLFEWDTPIDDNHHAFIPYHRGYPIGLANIAAEPHDQYEVCEYYILPLFRKQRFGIRVIHEIWRRFPGSWVIKQLPAAAYATYFWRKAIITYPNTPYVEDCYDDDYWGSVVRQRFEVRDQRALLF